MTTDSTQTRSGGRKAGAKPENSLASGDRAGAGLDRGFAGLAKAAGIFILIILAFVALFLSWNSVGAVYQEEDGLILGRFLSYAWPFALGTVVVAVLALVMAAPVSIGVALYISHYAPPRASKTIGYIIDLLAAIPSVVYGAWGMFVLAPAMLPLYHWLNRWLYTWPEENWGWGIPFFAGSPGLGQNLFTASVVLAVMVLPIISSVCREIFIQTPKLHEEAALALGATRWEMIKMAVFPFARAGVISGIMLGLGRALGETMAVVMVVSGLGFQLSLISAGNSTIPREIALNFGETAPNTERWHQLIALGLVLFIITLVVNMIARWIVSRHREFSGAN
ncbi:phosphate ABC transporter permease subunit PstC [Nesterenkonia muleiensis]|uniref:phosphate ABC transporter permease subunit PstC n=1 Tax=Nesterenkonia muleiensis TaxID=2282648 RepID=UPI003B75B8BE